MFFRVMINKKMEDYYKTRFLGEYIVTNAILRTKQVENPRGFSELLGNYENNYLNCAFPWDEKFRISEMNKEAMAQVPFEEKGRRYVVYTRDHDPEMSLKEFMAKKIYLRKDIKW